MSQFALVAGRRRNHTAAIACREPSRRPLGHSRAHLYLLAEHAAADGYDHELCHAITRGVQLAFVAEESAGAAVALERAVRSINHVIWEETRTLPAHRRLPFGLVAVAIDGADAYLCQVATGQAFILRDTDLVGLPALGYWHDLHMGAVAPAPALGQAPDLEPEVVHCRLRAGDLLVICGTNLARLMDITSLEALTAQPSERLAGHLCGLAEDYGLFHTCGMSLRIIETPAAQTEAEPIHLHPAGADEVVSPATVHQNLGSRLSRVLGALPVVAAAPPAPLAQTTHPIAVQVAEPPAIEEALPGNVVRLYSTPPLAPPMEETPIPEPVPARPADRPRAARATRPLRARWLDALAASFVIASDTVRRAPLAPRRTAPVPARAQYAARASRARSRVAEPVYRASAGIEPASSDGLTGAATLRFASLRWPASTTPLALALMVVAAALVVAAGVSNLLQSGLLPLFSPASSELARPPAAVQQAREQREAALAVTDPVTARETLEQASTLLTQAEATAPSPSAAEQIAAERVATQLALDTVNRVHRLGTVTVLADLSASGTPDSAPKQLIAGAGALYVLDSYANTLYLVDPAGKAPTPLLTKGWTIARQKVSDLVGATWRGDTLVVMDRSRAYTMDGPNGTWRVEPLATANLGLGAHPVASFGGSLYVLDNASRQVLKFARGAYQRSPQHWLKAEAADLSGAVDIAIDGRIYALTARGQILALFQGGLEKTLTVQATPAVQTPSALISPAGSDYLYLAEAGGRILKLTKDGALVNQLRVAEGSTDLAGLSDLVVDEANHAIYAVAGNRVVRMALPRPGAERYALPY
jgi:hypothetical protein